MQIPASNFTRRVDLEDYVKNELGDDIALNRKDGHTIEGSEEKLKELGLSPTNRVYGVKIVII